MPNTAHRLKPSRQSDVGRGLKVILAVISAAVLVSACGGGDVYATSTVPVNFNIGVTIGDRFVNATPINPGGSLNVAIRAGQSLRLDAGEPVVWTFFVGGSAIRGGAQVYYAGADITAFTINATTMGLDTFAAYGLASSIPVTFVATSTYDSYQVATVNVLITN